MRGWTTKPAAGPGVGRARNSGSTTKPPTDGSGPDAPGPMIDGRYSVARTDIDAVRQQRRTTPARPKVPDQSRVAGRSEPMHAALVAGDEQRVRRIARALVDEGAPVRDLITHAVAPALREIGEEWRAGSLTIGTEHRASAIVERVLGELAPNPRGRRRGTVMVAAIEGDHHTLPTTMAAVALREDNWTVHHLGSDMPAAELVSFCGTEPIDLMVLTVTDPATTDDCRAAASSIRALGIPVIVGGARPHARRTPRRGTLHRSHLSSPAPQCADLLMR